MAEDGQMPFWQQPPAAQPVHLVVNNSLTRSKVPFLSRDGSKHITWYTCGPTVYDSAHLGHARNYVSFDIVRRILEDYFKYDISFVMNVTDIDDKIIKRANESKIPFTELARKYEVEFMEDMKQLNLRAPHAITRVSEYVPEIITYVQKIIDNGYGYVSNGSVYFDTKKFAESGKHHYLRLMPQCFGNKELLEEGEGALGCGGQSEKRNTTDFVLWKASKPDEPKWDSPWGSGRPGWHIECSTMAGDILGSNIDVHSGGIDLRFPHHDNELAQAEAYFGCTQWINYFLHAGHLHISGLKMSKSLKNFITIRAMLRDYSPRLLRMLFLLWRYDQPMEFFPDERDADGNITKPGTMKQVKDVERPFVEFFRSLKATLRNESPNNIQHWGPAEKDLHNALVERQPLIHAALCDNFDTPRVMTLLGELVKAANVYMSKQASAAVGSVLRMIGDYITTMFRVFGLVDVYADLGFATEETGGGGREEIITPVLNVLAEFRDLVRNAARAKDLGAVLQACDAARDDILPNLGIRLEDKSDGKAVWKLDDRETLLKEIAQKRQEAAERQAAKEASQRAEVEKRNAKIAKAKVSPADYMKAQTATVTVDGKEQTVPAYKQFDAEGLPTHDHKNEPLSKSAAKTVRKEFDKQVELHKWFNDHKHEWFHE